MLRCVKRVHPSIDNNRAMRNKKTQTAVSADIEVRRSDVHGLGVFALKPLAVGSFVGRYEGRRYSEAEAAERAWDDRITYLFGLSDGSIIDGEEGGNETRHLNHACEPNCEAIEYTDDDGMLCLRIETMRTIRSGEELTLDYALQVDPVDRDEHPCGCGTASCRGTLI
jgi:SET domain-containing protein